MKYSGSDPILELHPIVIMQEILARLNVVEREQTTMLSVGTYILRNKGE